MKSQPQHSSLRSFIREILTEELISIVRENGDEEIWNVDLDGDMISNAKKVASEKGRINYESLGFKSIDKERLDAAFDFGQKYSTVSKGQLARAILNVQEDPDSGGVRQPWPGIQDALKIVRKHWAQTLLWPPANRKGRGEATFHIAFESVLQNEEPDFNVSGDERYSIKYFSNTATSSARNAGTPSDATLKSLTAFAKAIHLDDWLKKQINTSNVYASFGDMAKRFGNNSNLKPDNLRNYFQAKGSEDEKKKTWAPGAKTALQDLKVSILSEHKAIGMIVVTPRTNIVDFIPADKPEKLQIRYIRDDMRIEFGLEEMTDSLDKVIDELGAGHFDDN
jgi:hypothetical protein